MQTLKINLRLKIINFTASHGTVGIVHLLQVPLNVYLSYKEEVDDTIWKSVTPYNIVMKRTLTDSLSEKRYSLDCVSLICFRYITSEMEQIVSTKRNRYHLVYE